MAFLSGLFNRQKTIHIAREELAAIIGPLMNDPDDHSNESIAHGWNEAAEWLRIGFDCEKDKGSMYHALHHSMIMIARQITAAPYGAVQIEIQKECFEAIKSSYHQLTQASRHLDAMARKKATTPPQIVHDKYGNEIVLPPIQIYNRPYAAHDLMGLKLEEIQGNFDVFFERHSCRPASETQLAGYIPPKR